MPDQSRNLVRTAPVTTLTTIESLLGGLLTFLATHHVFGDIDVSATTQTIAPFVALALPAVFGAAKWRLVTPVTKVKEMAERDGLVTDADFARISAIIDDKLQDWGLTDEDDDDSDDDPDSAVDGADDPEDGPEDDPDDEPYDDQAEHRPEHEASDPAPQSMAAGG